MLGVPSFTFASGNARGLRRLPLYALATVATALVPRSRQLWVFGSGIGPGEGALALYRLARSRLGAGTRLIWLASTPEELEVARAAGLDSCLKSSGRGWWLTLRAAVAVVTHGLGDVNRFGVRGSFVVQLWHGIPLKRLHLDAPVASSASSAPARAVVRWGYRAVGRQIRLFPVSSDLVADRVVSAFGLDPSVVVVTGDPRDDVLLQGEPPATARAALADAVGAMPPGPVLLYAPTWRDGAPDPAAPDAAAWDALAEWLDRTDGTLVVRSHPLGVGDYADGPARSPRIRLLGQGVRDLTPLLPAFDVLVTDYSSTAFDFALTGGAIVFLAVDLESYSRTRGFYEPYEALTEGRYATSWTEVLAQLDEAPSSEPLRDRYFDHLDGQATERVFDEVLRRLEGQPARSMPTRRPVAEVELTADHLRLEVPGPVSSAVLVGPRERIDGTVEGAKLVFPLQRTRWGVPDLAPPSGDYQLLLDGEPARLTVWPRACLLTDLFRATVLATGGGLVLRIGPPLADDELGAAAQRRLRLASLLPHPRENAVYLESFYGRSASDNPLEIDRVLAQTRPDLMRYWSVGDRSVAVPEGAIPLVEYTREWWRVRASARVLVINDWLRWTHRRRRGQHVLQTWHGTMLKRLALDRPGRTPRMQFAVVRQSLRWHAMLAQNPYSAAIFRTSYAFRGQMWETGYPRNDVFARPDQAAAVRRRVGLPDNARVVLYAPTWRDDRSELVDHLDVEAFAAALPADHVVLVRGHSRTLAHGADRAGERVIDVTSYPDAAELMLVADVLITDYSSVMFDFAATGKPMVFFTPDLDHYADVLRGFYFDLHATSPGPVVQTQDELVDAVLAAPDPAFAERYAAWREKFTPWDDGHAAERVVRRMTAAGWLD
jgi:CDP-glycerol glycerophosphotransferase